MKDFYLVLCLLFGCILSLLLYGKLYGFGAQCQKLYPESQVEKMICVEKRAKGATLEEIWRGK